MNAPTCHGSKDVRVETADDPRIVESDDIVLPDSALAEQHRKTAEPGTARH